MMIPELADMDQAPFLSQTIGWINCSTIKDLNV